MANRRQRVDSVVAAVAIMQRSLCSIRPPLHVPLTGADEPFWTSIIAEKPKGEWTSHDLEIAALLARSLRKMEDEERSLDSEGTVLASAGGNPIQNPRLRVVADLHARAIKYRQTLGIHNRGKSGEHRDVVKRREITARLEANNPLEDDLLARPTFQ